MRPPSDEELILHYYGESERPAEIDAQIEASEALRRRYQELSAVLDRVEAPAVPPRSDLYGHSVWRKVRPQIERPLGRETSRWLSLPKSVGWAAAAALLLVLAFWAGRESATTEPDVQALSAEARDRILLAAVADHLDRTQFLLLELANAAADQSIGNGRAAARELSRLNRLYRLAARDSGETDVEHVLDELERFLTELSHVAPDEPGELADLVARLERQDLIFKVRALGAQLNERTRTQRTVPTA